jgi:hypothetical protein
MLYKDLVLLHSAIGAPVLRPEHTRHGLQAMALVCRTRTSQTLRLFVVADVTPSRPTSHRNPRRCTGTPVRRRGRGPRPRSDFAVSKEMSALGNGSAHAP